MLNIRSAGDHLYGKLLFTCLSQVMSFIVFFACFFFFLFFCFFFVFVLSFFFPRDVLDENWD